MAMAAFRSRRTSDLGKNRFWQSANGQNRTFATKENPAVMGGVVRPKVLSSEDRSPASSGLGCHKGLVITRLVVTPIEPLPE